MAGQINIDIDFSAGTSQTHEEAIVHDEDELQKQMEQAINESTKEAMQWEQKIVEAMEKNKVDPARIRREWLQPTLPYPLLKYEAKEIAKKIQAADKVPIYEGNINKKDDAQLIVQSQPKWRKAWLERNSQYLVHLVEAPKAIRDDLSFCPSAQDEELEAAGDPQEKPSHMA